MLNFGGVVLGRVTCVFNPKNGKMRAAPWCFNDLTVVEATVSTEAHQAPSVLMRRLVVWRLEVGGRHEVRGTQNIKLFCGHIIPTMGTHNLNFSGL